MSAHPWNTLIGQTLGTSEWFTVDQDRINLFAEATLDQQFIHVDPEAAAKTPFGGTIAHGLLTLSLLPHLIYPMLAPHQSENSTFINYGIDKLRFLHPVSAGAAIRCRAEVSGCEEKEAGNTLLRVTTIVDIRDNEKPALVADTLFLIINS